MRVYMLVRFVVRGYPVTNTHNKQEHTKKLREICQPAAKPSSSSLCTGRLSIAHGSFPFGIARAHMHACMHARTRTPSHAHTPPPTHCRDALTSVRSVHLPAFASTASMAPCIRIHGLYGALHLHPRPLRRPAFASTASTAHSRTRTHGQRRRGGGSTTSMAPCICIHDLYGALHLHPRPLWRTHARTKRSRGGRHSPSLHLHARPIRRSYALTQTFYPLTQKSGVHAHAHINVHDGALARTARTKSSARELIHKAAHMSKFTK